MNGKIFCACVFVIVLTACRSAPAGETAVSPPPPSPPPPIPPATLDAAVFAPPPRRLQAGELHLAADYDDIPAIFAEDTLFVDAAAGDEEWADDEFVIGVEINGDARAYPVRLMSHHEIVNDTVGGRPILVTWCPLCFSAIVFERMVAERELTFGVSGYLYFDNLVMYDHQTNTLWSQLLGQGVKGALRHEQLRPLPSQITSWAEWKRLSPATRVLSARQLGKRADELIDPYSGYYAAGYAGITGAAVDDGRLPPKTLVVGLIANKTAKAYALETLREELIVHDAIEGFPLLLLYDQEAQTAVAYHRQIGEQQLTFSLLPDGRLQDAETESVWDGETGTAVEGAMAGQTMQRLPAPLVYWFAWSSIHQGSDLFAGLPSLP